MNFSIIQDKELLNSIPSYWSIVHFNKILLNSTGGNAKIPKSIYQIMGAVPVIDQGKDLISGYINDVSKIFKGNIPAIVFGDHTRCFKYINFPFALGADGIKVLTAKINVNLKFLYYFFQTLKIPNTGYNRHYKYINNIQIPLPPLEIQQKIAAVLDKVDRLRQLRQAAIEKLDQLTQSIFLDMFGDPVSNPKGWEICKLKELGEVVTGNTPSRKKSGFYGNYIEWIKSDNINTPSNYLTKGVEYLSKEGMKVGRIAPINSILVTCIAGSKQCIGNAAIADRSVSFNQQINAILPSEKTNPYFLYVHLKVGKKLVQNASTNSMKGIVNKSKFENILFINPPLSIQNRFGMVFKKLESLKEKMQQSLDNMNDAFNSLLQKAFKGELEFNDAYFKQIEKEASDLR